MNTFKKLSLSVAALAVMSGPALANDMINNTAIGYVGGTIIQTADFGGETTLDVGSIVADTATNSTAVGFVGGNVIQATLGETYGDPNQFTAEVGTIKAPNVLNSAAVGFVGGSLVQVAGDSFQEGNKLTAQVGAIATGEQGSLPEGAYSYNNRAIGFVGGDLLQAASNGSTVKARIGSITVDK